MGMLFLKGVAHFLHSTYLSITRLPVRKDLKGEKETTEFQVKHSTVHIS